MVMGKKEVSRYDKIKSGLINKTREELIEILENEVSLQDLAMILSRPFSLQKYLLYHYKEEKNEEAIRCVPTDVLVEVITEAKLEKSSRPPSFSLERWRKHYWHGKRKVRAYPSGWS